MPLSFTHTIFVKQPIKTIWPHLFFFYYLLIGFFGAFFFLFCFGFFPVFSSYLETFIFKKLIKNGFFFCHQNFATAFWHLFTYFGPLLLTLHWIFIYQLFITWWMSICCSYGIFGSCRSVSKLKENPPLFGPLKITLHSAFLPRTHIPLREWQETRVLQSNLTIPFTKEKSGPISVFSLFCFQLLFRFAIFSSIFLGSKKKGKSFDLSVVYFLRFCLPT